MRPDSIADQPSRSKSYTPRTRIILVAIIFLLAFGVRLLSWHDTRLEVGKVQTWVTADYKIVARMLTQEGVTSFVRSPSYALSGSLAHPPGYSILIYLVYSVFGESDTALQFTQILFDSLAAVLAFLIVSQLFGDCAGAIAGSLCALSPQFAWNSVLLLPDALFVVPILVAVLLLVRATKNPRLITFVTIGALIGVSCWLRANGMFLTLFIALAVPLLISEAMAWRFALAVVCGTLLIVLPLTIRNAIVFRRFIPVSLGAGQTLLEGIADYDSQNRFNIPRTDVGILKQESEIYHRPHYYHTFWVPDGVDREQARLSRGFAVIRAHPFWFAGVMARRATTMLGLERSRLISTDPPVSHSLDAIDPSPTVWSLTPDRLQASGEVLSPRTRTSLMTGVESWLAVDGDESTYGNQFSSPAETVNKDFDYALTVPIKMETGRMRLSVKGASGRAYSSKIVEAFETLRLDDQPIQQIMLPFVSRESEQIKVVLSNEASNPANPSARLGEMKLYQLGPARFLWTRYPRLIIHGIQKIFLTAVMLPLTIIGLLILIFRKQSRALVILSIVPVYFFLVQSIVHTEYRYVLAVDYFLFAFAAVTMGAGFQLLRNSASKVIARFS